MLLDIAKNEYFMVLYCTNFDCFMVLYDFYSHDAVLLYMKITRID